MTKMMAKRWGFLL